MQLEIKTIIDFGEDGPTTGDMNDILRYVSERLSEHVLNPVCNTYGAKASTMTGWTSSGDDEDEGDDTYEVVKFFRDLNKEPEVQMTGMTLTNAKAECNGPDTSGDGWFIGFRKE